MSQRHLFYLIIACVLFGVIYSPTQLYFLSDDFDSILFAQQPAHLLHSFRPLSDASLYLDFSVWKMNAAGFHFTNLILHFSCVFCIYFFSKTILKHHKEETLSSKLALVCSLLFLFYPFHSEAIFWIVGRGAILCTLFGLLSLIFFLQKERRKHHYLLSMICFSAALLSYEEAWIIPVIITLFCFIYTETKQNKSFLLVLGFWFVFIFYLVGRLYFTKDLIGTPYGSERITGFSVSLLIKNFSALILRSFVLPLESSFLFAVISVSVMVVLAFLIIWFRKKLDVFEIVYAVCFLLSLLPVCPLGIDTHDTESERFLYFPSIFLLLFLVSFFAIFLKNRTWLVGTLLIAQVPALWQSYYSFVLSSAVCKTTVTALATMKVADTLFCYSLPDQYRGAFIFRNGFKSAAQLFKSDSTQNVVIVSRSELYHPTLKYQFVLQDPASHEHIGSLKIEWKEDEVVFSK